MDLCVAVVHYRIPRNMLPNTTKRNVLGVHLIVIKTEFGRIFGGYSPCHQLNENNLNKEGEAGGVIFQSDGDEIISYPCLKHT